MDSKKILTEIWKPIFKKAGFLKKGSSWYLRNTEVIGVFNIQKSQWSDLCYINLGLYVIKDEPKDFYPNEYSCHFRFRLVENNILNHDNEKIQKILNFDREPSESDMLFLSQILEELINIFYYKYSTKLSILEQINKNDIHYKWNYIQLDGRQRLGLVKS